jgi:uncharacterized membrane protein YhaH (DUF805 family)
MNWYMEALKKYADFSGRSRRKEYWMYALCNTVIIFVLEIAGFALLRNTVGTILFALLAIYSLATLIPSLAVCIRRLHDTGRSGWWLLIGLVPVVGFIVMLVFLVSDSAPETNLYGPNPKLA